MDDSAPDQFSQRALEVAEDLFEAVATELGPIDPKGTRVRFHLDGSDNVLDYDEAVR